MPTNSSTASARNGLLATVFHQSFTNATTTPHRPCLPTRRGHLRQEIRPADLLDPKCRTRVRDVVGLTPDNLDFEQAWAQERLARADGESRCGLT